MRQILHSAHLKTVLLTLALSWVATATWAQDGKRLKERLAAQRIAFITERVTLTPEQAQSFWPIYNEFTRELQQIRSAATPDLKVKDMNDEEAEKLILTEMEKSEKELALRRAYFPKLKKVISARQVLKLYKAERDFKSDLVKKLRDLKDLKEARRNR
jgi:hypothetical protein